MVHAGIPPGWDLKTTQRYATEVEKSLQQAKPRDWLASMYGNKPEQWKAGKLNKLERQRYTLNALTRMRYCHKDGRLDFKQKMAPAEVGKSHPELLLIVPASEAQKLSKPSTLVTGPHSVIIRDRRWSLSTVAVSGAVN
ncbi:MAG: hypothetical protein R3E95_08835 [Thiolinea sp.]